MREWRVRESSRRRMAVLNLHGREGMEVVRKGMKRLVLVKGYRGEKGMRESGESNGMLLNWRGGREELARSRRGKKEIKGCW